MKIRGKKRARKGFFQSLLKTVLICLILIIGFFFFRNREYFSNSFGERGRVAILFYSTNDSLLAVLDSTGNSLVFIKIPSDLYVELPGDYGDYKFGTIYKLGEIDKKGKKLIEGAAMNLFGMKVDGVVNVKGDIDFKDIKRSALLLLPKELNLGYLKFWWNAKRLKPSETKFFDLRESDSVSDLLLPDNSKALKFDSYYFDKQIGNLYLKDSLVISEMLKIEVLNGADISGLGEKMARYFTNLGLNVLSVSNSEKEAFACKVKYAPKVAKSYTLYKVIRDLSCVFVPYDLSEIPQYDLTVIFGENFYK